MKETDEERVVRQAKLQKALSAAYLSHQIDELETKVQKAHLGSSSGAKGPVVVLDASALLFAPKRVRDAVKAGRVLVVPLEVFHTLDLLKKGSSPLATAARAATRYIEHATRQVQGPTNSQGLRMQRSDESKEINLATNDPKPQKWVLSVLSCVHHFAPRSSFWVAKSTTGPGKPGVEVDEAEAKYGERALGEVVRFWAGVCAIEVVGVSDPLPEEKKEGKKVQERRRIHPAESQPPKIETRAPVALPPAIRAPPVLLKREPKVEEIPPPRPTTNPTVLQRPPAKVRTIGRYLDNDDDDDEPPKPIRQSQAKTQKLKTPRGGFTLLQRDTNPPHAKSEAPERSAPKQEPKVVLLQRPRG